MTHHYTYRCEWVRCGRSCDGCPHGPYWYAYWRVKGKLRKRYLGTAPPALGNSQSLVTQETTDGFDPDRPCYAAARRALGVGKGAGRSTIVRAYRSRRRRALLREEPDATREGLRLQAAAGYLLTALDDR